MTLGCYTVGIYGILQTGGPQNILSYTTAVNKDVEIYPTRRQFLFKSVDFMVNIGKYQMALIDIFRRGAFH